MIIRENYLKKIRPFYEQDLIKVITGIRRCGKSVILTQIIDEIKQNNIKNSNILYINFELKKNNFIKNDNDLYKYIKENMTNKNKYYIFLDEVQNITSWELAINSLKAEYKEKISIFITGSNSDLLSSELATHIAGRYVSFKIYPLTFKEICELKGVMNKNKYELQELFDNYIIWGGLPQRFSLTSDDQTATYLTDIYNSIIIKDIVERFNIKEIDLFNRIVEFVITNPAQEFSVENLTKYFESENRKVSKNTIYNYLDYMEKAFLISKSQRYDLRGKRILTGKYKYYLTDLGIGQIMNTAKKLQLGAYLENIVYNELLTRGYNVNIGNLEQGEIDFIATKGKEKIYFQVAYKITEENYKREFGSYKYINDFYPKYVISTDTLDLSENGIIHKNIIDWLLEK